MTTTQQPRYTSSTRKANTKSMRSRARDFALQALYQHLVGSASASAIDGYTRDLDGFHRADTVHYDTLLHGCIANTTAMDDLLTPQLDRPLNEISPIEHAVLWIGVYELQHCPDIPWRVVIYECVELAKTFGGSDGHKYVNGVLDKLALQLRAEEVATDKGSKNSA